MLGITFRARARAGTTYALMALAVLTLLPATARADDLWNAAKEYSATVRKAEIAAAKATIKAAAAALADALERLGDAKEAAEAAIDEGELNGDSVVAAATAVVQVTLAVTEAAAALAFAEAALALILAADVGTTIGEGADWCISYFWDPVHPILSGSPAYVTPTDAEMDALLEALIPLADDVTGYPTTKAEFEAFDLLLPGAGTKAWQYMRQGLKVMVISLRGAAANTAGLCTDTLRAGNDLLAEIDSFDDAVHQFAFIEIDGYDDAVQRFAHVFEDATIFPTSPQSGMDDTRAAFVTLETFVNDFADPVAAQAMIDEMFASLDDMDAAIATLTTTGGDPRPLEGPEGLYPSLTLTEYLAFLADSLAFGAAALPAQEAPMIDTMLALEGLTIPAEPSVGPLIAAFLGEGDTGGEAALFPPSEVMTLSEIMIASRTNYWQKIRICESPLWLECSLGDCGTWDNQGSSLPGTFGHPSLSGIGPLTDGSPLEIRLDQAFPFSFGYFVVGFSELNAPLEGGILVPDIGSPGLFVVLPLSATGSFYIFNTWPTGVPPGVAIFLQYWIVDPGGPVGFSASNALKMTSN